MEEHKMAEEIGSLMSEERVFNPPKSLSKQAYIKNHEAYERLYRESINSPETFWARQAEEHLVWFRKWDTVMEHDFSKIGESEEPYVRFFINSRLNVSFNCLDRHLDSKRKDKTAIIWQGESDDEIKTITYGQLHREVCKFANVLKKHGVTRGSRVTIFLPMIPELAVAMLACARIGAVHSVVFSAFSSTALRDRIDDCASHLVITSDVAYHGGKTLGMKEKTDEALSDGGSVKKVMVFKRGEGRVNMKSGRDFWWHEEMEGSAVTTGCPPEEMDAEDPLFILYTSGSTGKPKGVLHTTAGYLLYVHLTTKWIFDIKDEDIHWCTADIGWVTGHSYLLYGPLSNGATTLMFEGIPTYPQPDRFWKIIDDHKVTIFYTAPTVIRALMRLGEEWPNKHDLSSLRILGSVGEPINPEAWMWYYRVIGKERCPVLDTWWQTETGGILITPLPGAIPTKPGSASKPFFGVVPEILRKDGTPTDVNEGGNLVITRPWPGMLRGVYGDPKHTRIKQVYFSMFPEKYFTGDGCRLDSDGFYWLMGRIDDVINVSGHRIGTAEIESALVAHKKVAEAAVVGYPHDIKGQGIYCYVTLNKGDAPSEALKEELVHHVRTVIGPIAKPDKLHFTDALPKTRSGKIVRRILRKIAAGEIESLGDMTTLADPSLIDTLIKGRV
jgi:acetyl-CoA synthetase